MRLLEESLFFQRFVGWVKNILLEDTVSTPRSSSIEESD